MKDRYPHYRYGGMWKNRHADGPTSAKKPQKVKDKQKEKRLEREKVEAVQEGKEVQSEGA